MCGEALRVPQNRATVPGMGSIHINEAMCREDRGGNLEIRATVPVFQAIDYDRVVLKTAGGSHLKIVPRCLEWGATHINQGHARCGREGTFLDHACNGNGMPPTSTGLWLLL